MKKTPQSRIFLQNSPMYRLLLLFFSCLTPTLSLATTYYLSATGNDTNPGTEGRPWKSLARASKADLKPGDQLLFRGGDTFTGFLSLGQSQSGTATAAVQIGSYGKGKAILNGGKGMVLYLNRIQFVQVRNLILKGDGRKEGNTQTGLFLNQTRHTLIEDLDISGFQKSGMEIHESEHVQVIRVVAHNNGFAGISASAAYGSRKNKHLYIGYCRAENNPGDPTNLDNHSGNGIVIGEADTVMVEHCIATNNGWDMPRKGNGPVGIWFWHTNAGVIQHCIAHDNKTAPGAMDGGGFDLDGGVTNSVIQYCLSYNNEGAGYGLFQFPGALPWHNNVVRYCISENDGKGIKPSVLLWNGNKTDSGFSNCKIYHNVFRNDLGPVIGYLDEKHRDFFFYNNLVIGKGELFQGKSRNVRFEGNLWWSSVPESFSLNGLRSLEAWVQLTGQEKVSGKMAGIQADPGFSMAITPKPTRTQDLSKWKGYRIPAHSAARNAGVPLKTRGISVPAKDFFGQPTQTGTLPDIGPGEHP